MPNLTPGQLPALAMALVSAVVDLVAAFAPTALSPSEKTAIIAVASTAIPLGIALYSIFGHQMAMHQMAMRK
jgi:hypothetical protein